MLSSVSGLDVDPRKLQVTNFWDPSIFPNNPKGEIEQGKNLAEAAKAAGVKFIIYRFVPPSCVSLQCLLVNRHVQLASKCKQGFERKIHQDSSLRLCVPPVGVSRSRWTDLNADKALVEDHIRESGVPHAFLHTGTA
jgi:hypothetical protein